MTKCLWTLLHSGTLCFRHTPPQPSKLLNNSIELNKFWYMIEMKLTCREQNLSEKMWYDQAGCSLWWAKVLFDAPHWLNHLKASETSITSVTKHKKLWYSLFSTGMGVRSVTNKSSNTSVNHIWSWPTPVLDRSAEPTDVTPIQLNPIDKIERMLSAA